MERVLAAPHALDLEGRATFRRRAEDALGQLPEGGTLVLDLRAIRTVDSAGLAALVVVQRRAAARGQTVRLTNVREDLRALLALSRLADLFDMRPDAPA